jgi:Ca-activated chloride channel homolog
MRGTALATCLVAAAAAAAPTLTAQQAFRAGVDLVHLPVVVTDRRGQIVRGLEPSDFEILEDGKPQKIAYFAEGAAGEAVPLHLGLMLDKSDSMQADLRAAADAAIKFVNALDEAVDVTFVDFDTSINVGRFSPASYPRLFERIRDQKTDGGGTSLYDAISRYVGSAADRDGQHVLLLCTDGGDSTSTTTYSRMQDLLRLGNVLIYAVGYLENQLSSQRVPQQMRLSQIARETGGDAHFPGSAKEIDTVYGRILSELQSRYTIGYVSSNPPAKSRFRKVEARITRADLKGVKVRTRTGYLRAAAADPAR